MATKQDIQPTFERGKLVWTDETKEYVRIQVANGQSAKVIATTLGVTRSAVLGGKMRYKLGSIERPNVIPAGFAELWPTMQIQELAAHYNVDRATPSRWARRLGLSSKAMLKPPKPKPRKGVFYASGPQAPLERYSYEDSELGEAHRQCGKYAPTFRVPGGWRYGSAFLTDTELLTRADFLRSREAKRA